VPVAVVGSSREGPGPGPPPPPARRSRRLVLEGVGPCLLCRCARASGWPGGSGGRLQGV